MRLPAFAQSESVRIGEKTSVQVSPADAKWIINIQSPITSNEKSTIAEVIDRTVEAIRASVGIMESTNGKVGVRDTQAKIFDRVDDLALAAGPAARFYVSVPKDNDPRGRSRLVKGYTVFKPSPRQFVVFELICGDGDFSTARVAYETSVGTATFADSDTIALSRKAAITLGIRLFQGLTERDYLAAMGRPGKETWYRLYAPAPTGSVSDAQELGYRGVKFWKGRRGEIDPRKPPNTWNKAEQQEGFLVQDRSRVLVNGMVANTLIISFMSPDRREEAWSATTAVRDSTGKQVAMVNEIGSRLDNDLGVMTNETGKPTKSTKPAIAGEGYISQFEKVLLPHLLAPGRAPGEYGFYAWDTLSGTIVFRRETLAREGAAWTISTIIRDESKKQTTTLSDKGELLGAQLVDGRMWEPIGLDALKRLWQEKGLPTDK